MSTLRRFLCTLILLFALSAGFTFTAPAATAATISVSPPRFELYGNPGDVLNEKIKINNPTDADITYQVELENFTAQGDEGNVDFYDPQSNESYSLAKWITVEPTRLTVPAGQERILNYTIRIPRSGEPGGHYASVLVKLAGGDVAGGGASVQSRVGTLILLRVSGDVNEALQLENFRTDNSYYQAGPVTFNLRTKNSGNVHVAPTGTIVVTNLFGRKVKEIQLNQANVLPGASRQVKTTWEDKRLVGRYTATLVAKYGQKDQNITASTTFIVLPPAYLAVFTTILVFLFLLVTQRKKLRKIINKITSD
jgi:hypothetical protein